MVHDWNGFRGDDFSSFKGRNWRRLEDILSTVTLTLFEQTASGQFSDFADKSFLQPIDGTMTMGLSEKTVLIAGGGSGIGEATALAFAEAGCQVAIAGRNEEKLKAVADRHPNIRFHRADVSNREEALELVDWANKTLGRIDILMNSAGINIPKRSIGEIDPADWDRVMQVNATGAFNTIYAVLPQMRERKDGLIINISSVSGLRPGVLGGVAYNASKFAMTALGTCVGNEVRNEGVRVTNVYPGEVETPILDQRPVPVSKEHRARILQPEDIASMIVAIAQLPPRAHVPDLVIKPTIQEHL